jgi:hypothetical protein
MPPRPTTDRGTVLVAGSTGYVGGRLVPELLDAGYDVRVLTRSSRRASQYDWSDQVEVMFGFGAEIGISTQKLHARGPMALRELTTTKYVVWGDGQVRN